MYAFVRLLSRLYVRAWYRVEVAGEPFPARGPLLVAGNHTNGLMDVALLIERAPRPLRFLAKFKLFEVPLIGHLARGIRAIPVYRKKDGVPTELNQSSFEAVFAALAAGEAVVVFPEGESGTSHRLRAPLRTGIARMALGAAAEGTSRVRILPLGIHLHDRDRFRSRLELRVGAPFGMEEHVAEFRADPRAAVPRLMEKVEAALRAVGPDLRDDEDLAVLRLARGAWRWPGGAHHARLARLTEGLAEERARDAARCDARAHAAEELLARMHRRGLDPESLARGAGEPLAVGLGLAAAPIAALAALVWGVPAWIGRWVARRAAPPDKFVTVTALVTPLAGTLFFAALAAGAALAGRTLLAAGLVPGAWLLLAAWPIATGAWRRAWARLAALGSADLRAALEELLAGLGDDPKAECRPESPRPIRGHSLRSKGCKTQDHPSIRPDPQSPSTS